MGPRSEVAGVVSAPPRWLTTGQVGRRLGWSDDTVRRKCEDGTIKGAMRPPGQGRREWRIPQAWLEEALRHMGVVQ